MKTKNWLLVFYLCNFRSCIGIVLTMLFSFVLKAFHPPAASTTLLFVLGSFKPTVQDALTVMAGVLMIALIGEVLRRFRLGQFS